MREPVLIEDPTIEDGFEGAYLGDVNNPDPSCPPLPPLDFDLHAASEYMRKHGLREVTEEIREMFRKEEQDG